MSGGSARTIRRYSVELWQDLVLHGIRKSTFQHLTVNWNFNVLEMASKTLHIVQGLSRTPLLFIPQYLTNMFFKNMLQKEKLPTIGNLEISKIDPGKLKFRLLSVPGQYRGSGGFGIGAGGRTPLPGGCRALPGGRVTGHICFIYMTW